MSPRDLLNAFDSGNVPVHVGIARNTDAQTTAYYIKLFWRRLKNQHGTVVSNDVPRRPGARECCVEQISSERDGLRRTLARRVQHQPARPPRGLCCGYKIADAV